MRAQSDLIEALFPASRKMARCRKNGPCLSIRVRTYFHNDEGMYID